MHRIDAINRTTRQIMSGALQERMAVANNGDELDQLAGNLNAMLDQIEHLMVGMRQVTDSVAHDLRTPLTRLRSRLEITLVEAGTEDEYRAAIQEAISEADRLLGIFGALLSIAEAEAGTMQRSFQKVSLSDLARQMADLYEPAAEEAGLSFVSDIRAEPVVLGNQQLLAQAIANLLDNALKYTPAEGCVTLTVKGPEGERGACVSVADTGLESRRNSGKACCAGSSGWRPAAVLRAMAWASVWSMRWPVCMARGWKWMTIVRV